MASEDAAIKIALKFLDEATGPMRNSLAQIERNAALLGNALSVLKGAFAAVFSVAAIKELLDTAMALESINTKMKFSMGSAEQAGQAMEFVRAQSERLGLNVLQSSQNFASFGVATRGTALEGKAAREIFLSVAEAATVMGLSAEETGGVLTALTQMVSKGKVQAEELRGQLGERLPGAFQIAARAMNMTTTQLDKFMAEGNLTASSFLPKFAAQMRKEMAGSVGEASQSTRSTLNRLENAWTDLKKAMIDIGFLDPVIAGLKGVATAGKAAAEGIKTAEEAKRKGVISFDPYGLGAGVEPMKKPAPPKRPLDGADYSSYNEFSAPEEAFATGMADLANMLAERAAKLKEQAEKLRKEALTSFEVYKTKTREIQEVLDAGLISREQATANFAKAWNEYYKNYPQEKIQEEVGLAREASRVRQSLIEREMGALDAAFNQGRTSAADYYSQMTNLATQSSAERIALLQREAAGVEQTLRIELASPLKTPLEKDLLKGQAQTRLQQINAEMAEVETNLAKSLNAFAMDYLEKAKAVVDVEARGLQEIYENTVTSFDARAQAGQSYLEKRLQQIELERQANIRAGMPGAVAGDLAATQTQEAQRKVLIDQLTQKATLAQLNVQYAELTGNMETQLRTQIALIQATKERNMAEAKTPEIAEAYRKIYEEQARIANLRVSGSFWDGLTEGARRFRNSLPTIADEGINAFDALKSGIDSAADALAEFTVTGKMNFTDFANSVLKDIARMMYKAMLNRVVGGLLNGILGEVSWGSGKTFTSAGGATWSRGNNFLEHHAGGMAGSSTVTRFLPESLLAIAPRFHSGLAPDEIPAILQSGERVLSRSQNAAFENLLSRASAESKPGNVRIDIKNDTGQQIKAEQGSARFDAEGWVISVVLKKAATDRNFGYQLRQFLPKG